MTSMLQSLSTAWPLQVLLVFIAFYPMITAVVWAVVDCRRNPQWIKEHLDHLPD